MTAVVNETLRVRPVVPIVVRMLREELEVGALRAAGGHAGGAVHLPDRTATRAPTSDPEAFRPERFLDRSPETFSWIPFGGGIRRCIGASFAQLEMKLILRTMLCASSRRACPGAARGGAGEWDEAPGDHAGARGRRAGGVGAAKPHRAGRSRRPRTRGTAG